MASAKSTSTPADNFFCSICLEVFNDPVSTPCGHIYCRGCITGYWTSSRSSKCPLCAAEFGQTQTLQVNSQFRDMLELFKKTRISEEGSSPPGEGDVFCDLCHGAKRKALKSCLVCLASYCNGHLKPHHSSPALKWHTLINPVKTLGDRMCKKHNKVIEFFCKNDESCVCVLCLKENHTSHEAVSLDEEFKERKSKLKNAKSTVQQSLSKKQNTILMIQNSIKQRQKDLEATKAETTKAFDALVALIVAKRMTVVKLLEEKQQAAEQEAEKLIRKLQQEITEEDHFSNKLEELLTTEDDFRLLQNLPSLSSPSIPKHPFTGEAQHLLQAETVKNVMAKVEETLQEHMLIITTEINLVAERQTKTACEDELWTIQQEHAVDVTLDPDTAHPSLVISEDRKQVRDGGTKRNITDSPMRFDSLHFVLGEVGFNSGKFYFEVKLNGQTNWLVGVVRESVSRKGVNWSLSPENGCWTLGSYWGHCQANASPPEVLFTSKALEKIGVFVDYEGGIVSFYDVDARALIYSFTGCSFTVSTSFLRNVLWGRVYRATPANTKVYPLFRPSGEQESGSALLQITRPQ